MEQQEMGSAVCKSHISNFQTQRLTGLFLLHIMSSTKLLGVIVLHF